jgi:hypothetical protein
VADARRDHSRTTGALLAALAAAALLVAVLAGCGGSGDSAAADDPYVGYWIGAGKAQMTLVQIAYDGGKYVVLANPDVPVGDAVEKDGSLVVESHAVVMTFTPSSDDKLMLEFTGEMFKQPQGVSLKRVDEAKYADAATAYGVSVIRRGLAMWKAGGGKTYPPPQEVTPTGELARMIRWPGNLFTGQPMQPSVNQGDYTYTLLAGGKKYSLIGHLSDGSTVGD